MKTFKALAILSVFALVFSAGALAAQYYVVEKASGDLTVMDQKPEGKDEAVKGPFDSKEKAQEALQAIKDEDDKFYVIKTQAGEMRIVDHEPKGKAQVVEGPFDSEQKADQAMKEARDQDEAKGKSAQDQGKGSEDQNYYVVKTGQGDYKIVDHTPKGNAEVISGPFNTEKKAQWATKEAQEGRKQMSKGEEGKTEGDYYVIKGKGDNMKVISHKPKGQAQAVKGPFESESEARQALKAAKKENDKQKEAKGQDQKGTKDQKQAKKGKSGKKGAGYAYCLPPEKAKRMRSWYVVEDEVGRMAVRSYSGDQPILFGPFRSQGQAASAMMTGRCAR
jgi:hypothetical protein